MGPEHVDILLVDDSPDDTAFVLYALNSASLTATIKCARDGAEAISLIFSGIADPNPVPVLRPRLIILDLKLPKIDGKEVLRRLKGKLSKLRRAADYFAAHFKEFSPHTNFEMAAASLTGVVRQMDEIFAAVDWDAVNALARANPDPQGEGDTPRDPLDDIEIPEV